MILSKRRGWSSWTMLVFLTCVLVSPLRVFAADPNFFHSDECQAALKEVPSDNPSDLARAKLVITWLTMTHPVISAFVDRTTNLEYLYQLLFLTSGFALPPDVGAVFARSASTKYWNESVCAWNREEKKLIFPKNLDSGTTRRLQLIGTEEEWLPRITFLSKLLHRSFLALSRLTDPKNNFGVATELKRESRFELPIDLELHASLRDPRVEIQWIQSFTRDELEQLRDIYLYLGDRAVRRHVVHLVNRELDAIVKKQQLLCTELQPCRLPSEFQAIFRALVTPLDAGEVESETLIAVPPSTESPTKVRSRYSGDEVERFVTDERHLVSGPLDRAPLFEVRLRIQEGARLLSTAVLELGKWPVPRLDAQTWSIGLESTAGSMKALNGKLQSYERDLKAVATEVENISNSISRLRSWIHAVNKFVADLDKSEDAVKQLSPSNQTLLAGIVNMAPALETLIERSLLSTEQRRLVILGQFDAILNVTLAIIDLGEANFTDAEGFSKLKSALETLSEGQP